MVCVPVPNQKDDLDCKCEAKDVLNYQFDIIIGGDSIPIISEYILGVLGFVSAHKDSMYQCIHRRYTTTSVLIYLCLSCW